MISWSCDVVGLWCGSAGSQWMQAVGGRGLVWSETGGSGQDLTGGVGGCIDSNPRGATSDLCCVTYVSEPTCTMLRIL